MAAYFEQLVQKYHFKNHLPQIGVFGKNLQTGKSLAYNADQEFGTASIIKIMIALTLFAKAQEKTLDLDKPLYIRDFPEIFKVGKFINGALGFLPQNATTTLRTACFFMLHLSDNPATNLILQFVSQEEVNAHARSLGYTKTVLTAPTIDPEKLESEHNYLGLTTPREMADIFGQVAAGTILKNTVDSKDLQRMLEADYPEKTYSRYLPVVWNVPDSEVKIKKIFVKNGSFPVFELRTETLGMITDKDEVICMGIFTQDIVQKDGSAYPTNLHPDHPAVVCIAEITKELFTSLY